MDYNHNCPNNEDYRPIEVDWSEKILYCPDCDWYQDISKEMKELDKLNKK